MAARTQMVTIPLEEYKELLLRERPDDKRGELCERMVSIIATAVKYDEDLSGWETRAINDNLAVHDGNAAIKEMVRMMRYVDFERYMDLWNKCASKVRADEAMQAQIDQMNKAKGIRRECEC